GARVAPDREDPARATEESAGRRQQTNRWRIVALAVSVVVALLLGYMFAESFWIEVKQYEYSSPQVPAEFDGTTIILLADIHRGWLLSQDRVHGLVEKVNDLHPNLIALAGDYVSGSSDNQASCFTELAGLKAPLGRFAVLGNHDYGEDPLPAINAIEQAGIELLDNSGVWIERNGERIRLGGVSDYREGLPELDPAVAGTVPADLVVLLSHNPDYAETLAGGIVDLMLSGHTHGGQVTFFGLWAPHLPSDYGQKYRTGMVRNQDTTVIISNGVGTIFPPMRFFARPQIVEITLRHAPGTY
ncbi:MAG TPA: metallophosphoesterase, partial [Thermoleophilia bacterium]|nr:metallophosphoesterase [Thermoleophilia bacterium]